MTAVLHPCSPPSRRTRISEFFNPSEWLGPWSRPVHSPTVVVLPRMSLLLGRWRFSLPGGVRLPLATFSCQTIPCTGRLHPRDLAPCAAPCGSGDLSVGVGRPLDRYRCHGMQWKLIRLPQYKLESDRVFGTVFPTSHFAALLPEPSPVRSLRVRGWCCLSGGSFSFAHCMDEVFGPSFYYHGADCSFFLDLGNPVVPWCV